VPILTFPLEVILFFGLVWVLFKLFCKLANSPRFSKTLKAAGGSADTEDEIIDTLDKTESQAAAVAAANEQEIAAKQAKTAKLRRRTAPLD
jgi:hypothetical protein